MEWTALIVRTGSASPPTGGGGGRVAKIRAIADADASLSQALEVRLPHMSVEYLPVARAWIVRTSEPQSAAAADALSKALEGLPVKVAPDSEFFPAQSSE
jgi:hypothetical protein